MHRRPVLTSVVTLVLAVGFAGCSGSTSKQRAATTLPHPVTTIAPTTTMAAPTTTVPAKATVGYPSIYDAANHLVDAWEAHDRVSAAQGADAVAVAGIFATPNSSMTNRGCSDDDTLPEGGCIYATDTGLVQVNTEKRSIGWVVATATYEPF